MDRAGRRFIVASPLIALLIVLLMASLSNGTPPTGSGEIQYAVPQLSADEPDENPIKQVIGKQPVTPEGRPGLLEVIAGARETGNSNHRHQNMSDGESRGLLEGLFGSRDNSNRKARTNRNSTVKHNHKHAQATPVSTAKRTQKNSAQAKDVNWDGIPYHRPSKTGNKVARAPIQDPVNRSVASRSKASTAATSQGTTRIIRGGSSKTTDARSVSLRTKSSPRLAEQEPTLAGLPKPPADSESEAIPSTKFSSTSSSQRSGRRQLQTLEASVVRKPTETSGQNVADPEDDVTLIPRIAKAPIETTEEVKQTETADDADSEQVARTITDQPEAGALQDSAAPTTALAAIGAPMVSSDSQNPEEATNNGAHELSEASGDYTVPIDPATAPVPTAGIPNHPYATSEIAGSTPATSVSHRSGPPSTAFEPAPLNGAPIGSGVVPRGDIAPYPQASEPDYQTARLPGSEDDPYGSHSPSDRLTNNGQPVDSGAASRGSANAGNFAQSANGHYQYGDSGHIPMHPIPGHPQSGQSTIGNHGQFTGGSDNFDRSTYQTRNQMRAADGNVSTKANAAASELPGIRVVTRGPSEIMIRQTSQFEIHVENRGSIDAEGVLVRAMVPDWADLGGQNASIGNIAVREQGAGRQLVWTIDQLPAGTSERMFVRLTAARSGNYDLDVDWTLLPQKSVTKIRVHEPRLDVTIEGPEEVVYGQSQTYKVRVLNPGDGTAPNVMFTLSPNSATPSTQRIGDIPAGKEAQFEVELTAQDLGDLKIHGLATGELELRAEAAKTIRVAAAKLEAMLNGPELKYQNSEANYNLQVQNTGSVASEKIMATLRLPTGVTYVGGIDQVTPQANMLRWEITSLPPGAIRNYQFTCTMNATGEHMFAFDCKGTAAGQTNVSISTQVESIADLVLTVNDPVAPAPIGSDVTYEIIIRNRGSKEANDVRAVAQFSHGIEPQRIEGQSGEVVTGQVLFDPIGRIGAGQEVRLRVIAQADRGGHHRFRSEVRSGDTVLVAEEATHYMSPKSERVSRHSRDSSAR